MRIRDASCQAEQFPGIYPCGEGAGYAGGITSAAVDGIEEDRFRMKDGEFVPISRRKYGEVKKQYTDFLMKKLTEKEET